MQANVKTAEGRQHPDRDAQFGYLNDQVKAQWPCVKPARTASTCENVLQGSRMTTLTQGHWGSGLRRTGIEPKHLSPVRAVVHAPAVRVGHMVLTTRGRVPPRQRMPRPLRRIDTRRVVLEDRLHVRRSRLRRKTTAGLVVRLGRRLHGGRHSKMPQVTPAYADGVTDRAGAPHVRKVSVGWGSLRDQAAARSTMTRWRAHGR